MAEWAGLCLAGVALCALPLGVLWGLSVVPASFPGMLQAAEPLEPRHTVAEEDEHGNVIAYRYFLVSNGKLFPVTATGMAHGRGCAIGELVRADAVPTETNLSGFYAAKTPDSPVLEPYRAQRGTVLARVLFPTIGWVIEGEYGYRSEYQKILNVWRQE